jgi:D-alanyl-lipoteichoic acid acyltransferase DltB (MBOAT superfamily)
MGLTQVLIFAAAAILLRLLARGVRRGWLLLVASAVAIYWLQPGMPIRYLDFWLPTATLGLASLSWVLVTPREVCRQRENWLAGGLLAGVVLAVAVTRFLGSGSLFMATRPPQFGQAAAGAALVFLLVLLAARFLPRSSAFLTAGTLLILVLFVVIKVPALSQFAAGALRTLSGQDAGRALPTDIRWLGFSYVAFRLIHTLRDSQTGRLPAVSLRDYLVYALFFPAFTAGPIDRLPRFQKELEQPFAALDLPVDLGTGGQRFFTGLFKKFVVADSLSLIALNGANAAQVRTGGWAYLMLIAYSFLIYFDFSGYTDIAIGLGRVLGFQLPENFNHPYLKPNLTLFWNNWHMTLTQWFRAYFFNPFTRSLRRYKDLPAWVVILVTQLATMTLIGLWHGATLNFLLWGAWHGLGLFVQNRWSDWLKPRSAWLELQPWRKKLWQALGVVLTFHYVALGWLFFALPSPTLSWRVLNLIFGG